MRVNEQDQVDDELKLVGQKSEADQLRLSEAQYWQSMLHFTSSLTGRQQGTFSLTLITRGEEGLCVVVADDIDVSDRSAIFRACKTLPTSRSSRACGPGTVFGAGGLRSGKGKRERGKPFC